MLDFLTSPYFVLFARVCLAGVFLVSGFSKLNDRTMTAVNLGRYPFLPQGWARLLANYFPFLELLAAFMLLLGVLTRLAAVGTVLLYVIFTSLIIYDLIHRQNASCHCFGRLSSENLTWMSVVRNLALLGLAAVVFIGFDGWLALDSALSDNAAGGLGLVAIGSRSLPGVADAVPVVLIGLAAVALVVLGGHAANLVRTTLRGMGYRS